MRRALLALMFLLPLVPAAAAAQMNRFEVTPFAGYRLSGEIENAADIGFDHQTNVDIDESAFYGLLFNVALSPNWQIEFLASRQKTSFAVDEGLLSPSDDLGYLDLGLYQAGFLLQWGGGQVIPFVTGTLGLARLEPDFPELDAENYFAGTFGGGVKIFFDRNVGLRLEGRGTWIDVGTSFDDHHHYYDDSYGVTWLPEAAAGVIIAW